MNSIFFSTLFSSFHKHANQISLFLNQLFCYFDQIQAGSTDVQVNISLTGFNTTDPEPLHGFCILKLAILTGSCVDIPQRYEYII